MNGSCRWSGWGNLTNEPKFFGEDTKLMGRVGVAINLRRRSAGGEYADKTLFVELKLFGPNAKFLKAIVDRQGEVTGSFVSFSGSIDFTDKGEKRYFDVLVDDFALLDSGSRDRTAKTDQTSEPKTNATPTDTRKTKSVF
jgi:hypothetical protein